MSESQEGTRPGVTHFRRHDTNYDDQRLSSTGYEVDFGHDLRPIREPLRNISNIDSYRALESRPTQKGNQYLPQHVDGTHSSKSTVTRLNQDLENHKNLIRGMESKSSRLDSQSHSLRNGRKEKRDGMLKDLIGTVNGLITKINKEEDMAKNMDGQIYVQNQPKKNQKPPKHVSTIMKSKLNQDSFQRQSLTYNSSLDNNKENLSHAIGLKNRQQGQEAWDETDSLTKDQQSDFKFQNIGSLDDSIEYRNLEQDQYKMARKSIRGRSNASSRGSSQNHGALDPVRLDYLAMNQNTSFGQENESQMSPVKNYGQDKLDTLITQVQSLVNATTAQKNSNRNRNLEEEFRESQDLQKEIQSIGIEFAKSRLHQIPPENFNNTIKSVDDGQFNTFLSKIDTVLNKCEKLEELIKHSPRLAEVYNEKAGKSERVKFQAQDLNQESRGEKFGSRGVNHQSNDSERQSMRFHDSSGHQRSKYTSKEQASRKFQDSYDTAKRSLIEAYQTFGDKSSQVNQAKFFSKDKNHESNKQKVTVMKPRLSPETHIGDTYDSRRSEFDSRHVEGSLGNMAKPNSKLGVSQERQNKHSGFGKSEKNSKTKNPKEHKEVSRGTSEESKTESDSEDCRTVTKGNVKAIPVKKSRENNKKKIESGKHSNQHRKPRKSVELKQSNKFREISRDRKKRTSASRGRKGSPKDAKHYSESESSDTQDIYASDLSGSEDGFQGAREEDFELQQELVGIKFSEFAARISRILQQSMEQSSSDSKKRKKQTLQRQIKLKLGLLSKTFEGLKQDKLVLKVEKSQPNISMLMKRISESHKRVLNVSKLLGQIGYDDDGGKFEGAMFKAVVQDLASLNQIIENTMPECSTKFAASSVKLAMFESQQFKNSAGKKTSDFIHIDSLEGSQAPIKGSSSEFFNGYSSFYPKDHNKTAVAHTRQQDQQFQIPRHILNNSKNISEDVQFENFTNRYKHRRDESKRNRRSSGELALSGFDSGQQSEMSEAPHSPAMHKVSTRRAKFKATDVFSGTFRGEEFLQQELDVLREKHGLDSQNTTPASTKQDPLPSADLIQVKKFDEKEAKIQIRKDYSTPKLKFRGEHTHANQNQNQNDASLSVNQRQHSQIEGTSRVKDAFVVEDVSGLDFQKGDYFQRGSGSQGENQLKPVSTYSQRQVTAGDEFKSTRLSAQSQHKPDTKIDLITSQKFGCKIFCTSKFESNILIGFQDGGVSLFRYDQQEGLVLEKSQRQYSDPVTAIAVKTDVNKRRNGQILAAYNSETPSIVIFNYPDMVATKELLGHKGTISNLQMVSHQYLVSTGLDNTIICWDLNDYRGVLSLDIHKSPILSLCYDEESECIFTGSLDSTVIVSGLEFNDGELVDCKVLRKINVSGPVLNLNSVGAEKLISFENSKLRIYDSRGVLYRDIDTKCLPKTHSMINADKGLIVDVSGQPGVFSLDFVIKNKSGFEHLQKFGKQTNQTSMQSASELMAMRLNGCNPDCQILEENFSMIVITVGFRNDEILIYKLRK